MPKRDEVWGWGRGCQLKGQADDREAKRGWNGGREMMEKEVRRLERR